MCSNRSLVSRNVMAAFRRCSSMISGVSTVPERRLRFFLDCFSAIRGLYPISVVESEHASDQVPEGSLEGSAC